jgi:putative chitinase
MTLEQALKICKKQDIAEALLKCIDTYKMPDEALDFFLANVLHESGTFSIKSENMNYTTPARLIAIWPSRFNANNAPLYVKNPTKLANFVYSGRMGNIQPNDGFNFRGGGFAQITGRDSYTAYTIFLNRRDLTNRTIAEVATLVMTDNYWAMDSAFWFFIHFKKLVGVTDFPTVVRRWNGGLIGFEDRKKQLAIVQSV